ncbi:lysophospholipid acyltransferase family protein [Loktanella sp. SALINAS62]|uniref:lysophospholipid acyltransferase family protein n=1 Tax=Loktanella sp. SALINAS62 TaxID=2706124 RepID=UPI001B8BF175|nr:lysophospholipid acyltransferase family protein [Loktanella sp. SALINAS62]MBS1303789.1 glycerol acyltransferase [Loktanella sp. SALINAS62]
MKDRITPLIEERAPWMYRRLPGMRFVRGLMHLALAYDKTVAIAEDLQHAPSREIMDHMADRLAKLVDVSGLSHLPRSGPALIVANHPTGIADGIILWHVMAKIRPDMYFFANSDILRVMPQMDDLICPVEWRMDRRSREKTRDTMAYVRQATQDGRLGVIFPSGRLAKRRKLKLHERDWMPSAAMLARKFGLPVIPVNVQARNSALFYVFDKLHPTLRDVTLFHETLNKDRQPYRVTIGQPIAADNIPKNSEDGIEMLKKATLALGGDDAPAVSLVRMTRHPLSKSWGEVS